MFKHTRITREAKAIAESLGHNLISFHFKEGSRGTIKQTRCRVCGKEAKLTFYPLAGEDIMTGRAFTHTCKGTPERRVIYELEKAHQIIADLQKLAYSLGATDQTEGWPYMRQAERGALIEELGGKP